MRKLERIFNGEDTNPPVGTRQHAKLTQKSTSSGHYYKQKLIFYVYSINDVCDLYINHIHHLLNESKK